MTLTFTTKILHEGNLFDFLVEYDTVNPNDNDIVNILYNGFTLDSVAMQFDHPAVYKQLEAAMENNSETYWSSLFAEQGWEDKLPPASKDFLSKVKIICEDYNKKILSQPIKVITPGEQWIEAEIFNNECGDR